MISYVFRRIICQIPTNSHLKTFQTLGSAIDPDNYAESVCGRLLTLQGRKRFPTDVEFSDSLCTVDLYNLRRSQQYFFRKMENFDRKEEVSIADYSIEHILPQNENLSPDWQAALGTNWKEVQERLLHTLGNLTLTGYNPEYSDKPFPEKRDMKGGFKQSPLHLNQGLGQLEAWNEQEITTRATRLADRAVDIWKRPDLDDETLAKYRGRDSGDGRFDWTLTHAILAAIPDGNWTSYHYLAEAVGTVPQVIGSHVGWCTQCVNGHRVLTWDGRVAEMFHWTDPDDDQKPMDVLQGEGIRFENGTASKEQQLVVEDLLALVEEID
jgi:alkylated DNA nucleotide flippase Atl1